MNTRSLYFRLILWYSGLIVIVSLAFGAYTYHSMRNRLYGEMERTLARRARQIAENTLMHSALLRPKELADQINDVYSPAANNRFIRISDGDHHVIYISQPPKDGSFDPDVIAMPVQLHHHPQVQILPSGFAMLMVNTAFMANGVDFLIEMGAPTREMEHALHGLVMTLLFGLPIVVLIVSAGGYMLVRRSLKPVEDIRATAEKITFGNLSNRLPVAATGDALEHLSVTLNQMLGRLEDAYLQVSRFSADASHELRTPLTIMRGELEAIMARELNTHDTLHERIGSVLEEVERLSRITESLFAISRFDAGEGRTEPATFSLADLVKSTTEQMLLLAEVKGISIAIDARDSASVMGDAAQIKQVVVNLLDNAIKYTPQGGSIRITIEELQRKSCLSITDSGIGICADALPHVFERFYRTDTARSREEGGAGLGLSIARAICHAHGGTIEAESIEEKGATFRVCLPLAEANVSEKGAAPCHS